MAHRLRFQDTRRFFMAKIKVKGTGAAKSGKMTKASTGGSGSGLKIMGGFKSEGTAKKGSMKKGY
jgi:hypothetical protein